MVGEHLQRQGVNAKANGAILYCPPLDIMGASHYFFNNLFGFYSYVLGMFLNNNLHRLALPHMKKYTTKEEGERMEMVFQTNRTGLKTLDENIYTPMFGFKDVNEYYRGTTLAGKLNKIKVPTFSLGTLDD